MNDFLVCTLSLTEKITATLHHALIQYLSNLMLMIITAISKSEYKGGELLVNFC